MAVSAGLAAAWAFPAMAEVGPGVGLAPPSGQTVIHTAVSGDREAAASAEGTASVELGFFVADITGQNGVEISAQPGGGGSCGYAYPGSVYKVTKDLGNGWLEILYDGHAAYLEAGSGQVTVKDAWPIPEGDSARSEFVRYVIQYLGSHYQMGGNDPVTGVDCSGYVRYVLENGAGILMPRTSGEQALMGTDKTAETMQAGDLIAYGSSLSSVGHVGIYIGDGRMIHGDGTGKGVTICGWDDRTDIPRIFDVLGQGSGAGAAVE